MGYLKATPSWKKRDIGTIYVITKISSAPSVKMNFDEPF